MTPETPDARMEALTASISERVLVTAHTHVQFDRGVVGVRSINAGSVGMPYEPAPRRLLGAARPGRRVAPHRVLGRRGGTAYRETDDPLAEQMAEVLLEPPTRDEAIEHAEKLEFSG